MSFFFVLLFVRPISIAYASETVLGSVPDPVRKLLRVRDGGREQDDVNMIRQHDNDFFPDDTALCKFGCENPPHKASVSTRTAHLRVVDIMHFVEDDELDIPYQVRALVEHAAQNLRGHDEAVGFWIDLDVSRQYAYRGGAKRLLEVAVLLVRERLDRRSVDGPGRRSES